MKKTAAFPMFAIMTIMMLVLVLVVIAFILSDRKSVITLRNGSRLHLCARPFDDPFKLVFLKPNSPALRAVIDLCSLSLRHQQKTLHAGQFMIASFVHKIMDLFSLLDTFLPLKMLFDWNRLIRWIQEIKGGALFKKGLGRSEEMKGAWW
jgi:hypothetical protein